MERGCRSSSSADAEGGLSDDFISPVSTRAAAAAAAALTTPSVPPVPSSLLVPQFDKEPKTDCVKEAEIEISPVESSKK